MKVILYYLGLLVLLILLSVYLLTPQAQGMNMTTMVSISVVLAGYVVAMSLLGEGRVSDEREMTHRYIANRLGLLSGTVILSTGVLIQLFTHRLDFWLLGSLIGINAVKIFSLIYSHYRN